MPAVCCSSIASRTAASSMALKPAWLSSPESSCFRAATRSGGRKRLPTTSARQVPAARIGLLSTAARCALMAPPSAYSAPSGRVPRVGSVRLVDSVFERVVGLGQLDVELSRAEQVANAQHYLIAVQRLGQEVIRAQEKCAGASDPSRVGGQHDHREESEAQPRTAQALEDFKTVRRRHA